MADANRYCDQCGAAITSTSSRYCRSCGAEIGLPSFEAEEPPRPTPTTPPSSGYYESPTPPQPGTSEDETIKNPVTYVAGFSVLIGWIWAVVVFFQHSDSWLWLWGFGWTLAILFGFLYAIYEAFVWGEWIPTLIIYPSLGIAAAGARLGNTHTLNRMLPGVLFCLTIYFLPFGIGLIRNKRAKLALFFVNLIGGWTIIIWVIALVWALIPRTGDTTVPVINARD